MPSSGGSGCTASGRRCSDWRCCCLCSDGRSGAPPPVLLGSLASHFRKLARLRSGGPVPGHPFVVRKLESQAQRYPPGRLVACLHAIHGVDEALKGQGSLPADIALERLVIGLRAPL